MNSNILIDRLPTSIIIDNIEYEINSDFRTSILFEMMMQDDEVSEDIKVIQSLELYYPIIPDNIEQAINKILWFYKCGKDVKEINNESNSGNNTECEKIYDFDFDANYIYSAFLEQYRIDLQDIEYLHWWKFKALFDSLNEDSKISKIMSYRSIDLRKIEDKEQRAFYKNMKKIYEIPISEKVKKAENDLIEALINNNCEDMKNLL